MYVPAWLIVLVILLFVPMDSLIGLAVLGLALCAVAAMLGAIFGGGYVAVSFIDSTIGLVGFGETVLALVIGIAAIRWVRGRWFNFVGRKPVEARRIRHALDHVGYGATTGYFMVFVGPIMIAGFALFAEWVAKALELSLDQGKPLYFASLCCAAIACIIVSRWIFRLVAAADKKRVAAREQERGPDAAA